MKEITRTTKETKISLKLELLGSGKSKINTQIGFFDHMLESFARHSLIDLELSCEGDTFVDDHHSVEDVGIAIGQALFAEIFAIKNFERFSSCLVLLDEAAVEVSLDLSGRAFLHYDLLDEGLINNFDLELVEEFFKSLVHNAKITSHIVLQRGKNKHHIVEAAFKAFGVALRRAIAPNERIKTLPTSKGVLV